MVQRSNVPLIPPSNLTSDDDEVIIEDEGGRVKLSGDHLDVAHLVTGRLWVTGHRYRFQVTGNRLQVTGYGLQITSYRLQVTDYRYELWRLYWVLEDEIATLIGFRRLYRSKWIPS